MRVRHLIVGAALTIGTVAGFAAPAIAHDCFNPNKPAGAGVNYTITGFDPNTGQPIFEQTGPGKGIGGFATVDGVDIHTIGNSQSHDVVGGPGSQKPEHACDSKGIDYASACGLEG
jgi:hypothetical protein